MPARRRGVAALLVALVLVSGCVGEDSDGGDRGNARRGGSITVALESAPATLDPAAAQGREVLGALWLAYTPPLTLRHAEGADGTQVVPGLAEEMPERSEDGRTYSFRFRRGLRYSDGTRLRASDFRHTIERSMALSPEARRLFAAVRSITADDRTREVTVRLRRRDGSFEGALATTHAGLVPGRTPPTNTGFDPPPGIGPYSVVRGQEGRGFLLRNNVRFSLEGVPQGNLDEIAFDVRPGAERRMREVIEGTADLMEGPAPRDSLPELRSTYGNRYRESDTIVTSLVEVDATRRPFDDSRVRRALNLAVDGDRLSRLLLGRLEPGCTLIPPQVPGYAAPDPCPFGPPTGPGDLPEASRLVDEADVRRARVTLWTSSDEQDLVAARYLVSTMDKLGLRARISVRDGRPPRGAQLALVHHGGQLAYPGAYLRPLRPRAVDDRELTDEVRRLSRRELDDDTRDDWSALDTQLVTGAHVVPLGIERRATFASARLDLDSCFRFHPVYGADLSSLCLR